jgi:putative Mn2+ efflux pump MntP
MDFLFFMNSALFGIALAMDAFSVSIANGINEPCIKPRKALIISGIFAIFQALMPLIGWVCVHTIVEKFAIFEQFIPYIALALLSFLGIKMIVDGKKDCDETKVAIGFLGLIVQGIATSIDALSVGFTIANMKFYEALVCCLIIAIITFIICFIGVYIGKKFGNKFNDKAEIIGGIILIIIGLEIFLTNIF